MDACDRLRFIVYRPILYVCLGKLYGVSALGTIDLAMCHSLRSAGGTSGAPGGDLSVPPFSTLELLLQKLTPQEINI